MTDGLGGSFFEVWDDSTARWNGMAEKNGLMDGRGSAATDKQTNRQPLVINITAR